MSACPPACPRLPMLTLPTPLQHLPPPTHSFPLSWHVLVVSPAAAAAAGPTRSVVRPPSAARAARCVHPAPDCGCSPTTPTLLVRPLLNLILSVRFTSPTTNPSFPTCAQLIAPLANQPALNGMNACLSPKSIIRICVFQSARNVSPPLLSPNPHHSGGTRPMLVPLEPLSH